MYKCTECGNLFEEGEQAAWEETHGLDSPPYEKFSGCPVCKGGYEESISAIRAEIGTPKTNSTTVGAKSAFVKPSTTTHSLSIARRTRTNSILKSL